MNAQIRSLWLFASPQLALFGVTALVFTGCGRAPYSSPTAVRDTNDYFKATSPPPPPSVDPTDLDQITMAKEGATLVATMPMSQDSQNPSDGFEHTVIRLKPGEKLAGDRATFAMIAFSVSGPGISATPTNGERSVPLDFFAPDGRPLATEELKAMGFSDWQLVQYPQSRQSYIGDAFPKLKVWFGSRKYPPGYFSPVGLFDARTRHALTGGNSYSQISDDYLGYAALRPRIWHATPMELVVDVELDGRSVVETNAIPGMTIPVVGGYVRLLGVWDGDSSSWSSQSRSAAGTQTIHLKLGEREYETNAVAMFVTEPPHLAVHISLLDQRGKEFGGHGGGSSGNLRMVGVRGRASEVKQVRYTVFTNHYRAVISLPAIPNLPAAGRNPANLFEVPIPLVKIQREHELRDLIGDLTEMRFQYPPGGDTLPTSLFPLMMTNVTPAELVALYRGNLTNSSTVVVDEKKNEIRVEPTQVERVKRWLRQKLRF